MPPVAHRKGQQPSGAPFKLKTTNHPESTGPRFKPEARPALQHGAPGSTLSWAVDLGVGGAFLPCSEPS